VDADNGLRVVGPNGKRLVNPILVEPLDESPAIVYVKDLDGRYLRVNRRYTEQLGVTEAQLCGRTDSEVPAREAIDGPRLADGGLAADEPLQLEYTVGPFEGRPALAVWRFPVHGPSGEPVAVCGVAAPVPDAGLARDECARLMEIERSSGAPAAVEAVAEKPRIAQLHEASAAAAKRAHQLVSELTVEREARELAERALGAVRARVSELERALASAQEQVEELEGSDDPEPLQRQLEAAEATAQRLLARAERAEAAVNGERERAERAEAAVNGERERAERAEAAARNALARAVHAEAASDQLRAAVAPPQATPVKPPSGPQWDAVAQRALTEAIAGASEWRIGVKDAVNVLGPTGGWDAICVWRPDPRDGLLRCFSMWTADPETMGEFETATWQRPQRPSRTELGEALTTSELRWLTTDPDVDDPRLSAVARQGMSTAVLVPVRSGAVPVALLELMARTAIPRDPAFVTALEGVALQLGHFWHLLSAGAQPTWRLGRL
jgi:hypothetical protein